MNNFFYSLAPKLVGTDIYPIRRYGDISDVQNCTPSNSLHRRAGNVSAIYALSIESQFQKARAAIGREWFSLCFFFTERIGSYLVSRLVDAFVADTINSMPNSNLNILSIYVYTLS